MKLANSILTLHEWRSLLSGSHDWWVSRRGWRRNYWEEAAVDSGKCACGMINSYVNGGKCNCDKCNDGTS